jgi:hypothetical protein
VIVDVFCELDSSTEMVCCLSNRATGSMRSNENYVHTVSVGDRRKAV